MPTNNFLIFDQNKANMLGDQAYAASAQRLGGVQSGVASAMLHNKFSYQVSLMAYAIAQLMNQNGLDASDTMAVTQFVNNLSSTLLQKIADKATQAQALAGTDDSHWLSPLKNQQFFTSKAASVAEVLAGTATGKYVTPASLAGFTSQSKRVLIADVNLKTASQNFKLNSSPVKEQGLIGLSFDFDVKTTLGSEGYKGVTVSLMPDNVSTGGGLRLLSFVNGNLDASGFIGTTTVFGPIAVNYSNDKVNRQFWFTGTQLSGGVQAPAIYSYHGNNSGITDLFIWLSLPTSITSGTMKAYALYM